MAWCTAAVLVALVLVFEVNCHEYTLRYDEDRNQNKHDPNIMQYITNKEYIQRIQSLIEEYKGEIDSQMAIEKNAMIEPIQSYRTWKRNADLINSLLALPKNMNDAGR